MKAPNKREMRTKRPPDPRSSSFGQIIIINSSSISSPSHSPRNHHLLSCCCGRSGRRRSRQREEGMDDKSTQNRHHLFILPPSSIHPSLSPLRIVRASFAENETNERSPQSSITFAFFSPHLRPRPKFDTMQSKSQISFLFLTQKRLLNSRKTNYSTAFVKLSPLSFLPSYQTFFTLEQRDPDSLIIIPVCLARQWESERRRRVIFELHLIFMGRKKGGEKAKTLKAKR